MHTKILLSVLIILIGLFSCGAIKFLYSPAPAPKIPSSYINLGDYGTFGSELDDGYWTMSFWIKTNDTEQMCLMGAKSGGRAEFRCMINTASDGSGGTGKLQCVIIDADGQTLRAGYNSDSGIIDGNWHNIVYQFSCPNDTIRFFVDGVRKTTTYGVRQDCDRTLDYNDDVYIGAYDNDGSMQYGIEDGGFMSEVALFKAELSLQCIASLASRKRCSFQVGSPYSYWRMNEFTDGQQLNGVTIKDFTGTQNGTGVGDTELLGYSDSFTY